MPLNSRIFWLRYLLRQSQPSCINYLLGIKSFHGTSTCAIYCWSVELSCAARPGSHCLVSVCLSVYPALRCQGYGVDLGWYHHFDHHVCFRHECEADSERLREVNCINQVFIEISMITWLNDSSALPAPMSAEWMYIYIHFIGVCLFPSSAATEDCNG